jgi:hypothetical protein
MTALALLWLKELNNPKCDLRYLRSSFNLEGPDNQQRRGKQGQPSTPFFDQDGNSDDEKYGPEQQQSMPEFLPLNWNVCMRFAVAILHPQDGIVRCVR